jgi:hypothetical protein
VAAIAVLAACGGSEPSAEPAPSAAEPTPAPAEPAPPAESAAPPAEPPPAESAPPAAEEPAHDIRFFQTPSKRIHCAYFSPPAYLRCDIGGGLRPAPRRPASCHLDWAQGISLTKTGRARIVCAGDTTADPSARVVPAGRTWTAGGLTCRVRRSGLTCENAARHGFVLSSTGWSRF